MAQKDKRVEEIFNEAIDLIDDDELVEDLVEIQEKYKKIQKNQAYLDNKKKCNKFLSVWKQFMEKYNGRKLPNIVAFRELFEILSKIRKLTHKFKNKAYMPSKLTSIYQKAIDDFYNYLHVFKDAINEQTIITDSKYVDIAREFNQEASSSISRTFNRSSVPDKEEAIEQIVDLTNLFVETLSKSRPYLPHIDELDELTEIFNKELSQSATQKSSSKSVRKVLPETLTTFPMTLTELRRELTSCAKRIANHASSVSGDLANKLIDESQMLTILANSEIIMDEKQMNYRESPKYIEKEEPTCDMNDIQQLNIMISQLKTENKRLRDISMKGNSTIAMTDRIKEATRRRKNLTPEDLYEDELESLRKERDKATEAYEKQCNENYKLKVEILEKENESLQYALEEKGGRGRQYTSSDSDRGPYRIPHRRKF